MAHARYLLLLVVAAASAHHLHPLDHVHELVRCFAQQGEEMLPCVKEGALGVMDRALTMHSMPLVEGVLTLERDPRHFLDASDELDLPVEREAREQRLDQLLWRRAFALLESSSLRIQLPPNQVFQGRLKMKKMKKLAFPLMIVMVMVFLAALAMKAVVVSKVALAVISWVFVKKFLNGGAKKETFEIIAKHPEHHDAHGHASQLQQQHYDASNHIASVAHKDAMAFAPYGRLFEAQALAFNAHQPPASSTPEPPQKDKTA